MDGVRILTSKDVSKRLGMGINQTRALIRRKDFPKIMVGKKALIPEDALEEWIHSSIYKKYDISV
ncbi:MAG: helix-turn-helix domain-containing protein [Lachnospiraceae bacterium]|nr:helix-turn-helix domain-containing protein [Lachnospiraceae bacterium]